MKTINTNNIICIRVRTYKKGKPLNDFQIKSISEKYGIDYFFLNNLIYNPDIKGDYLKVWLLRDESFVYDIIAFTEFREGRQDLFDRRDIINYFNPYGKIIKDSMNFDLNTIKPIDFPPFTEEKILTDDQIEEKVNRILDKINEKVKEIGLSVNEAKESLSKKDKLFLKSLQEK